MRPSFLVSGALGLAVAAGLGFWAQDLPYQEVSAGLGPAFFPHLLTGLLAALSLAMTIYGALARPDGKAPTLPKTRGLPKTKGVWIRPLIVFAVLTAFGFSIERIPAVVSVFVFLAATMMLLGETWARAMAYSAVASLFIYLLFGTVFGLPIFLV